MIFETYKGIDRTQRQGENSRVIFSESYGNLNQAKHTFSDETAYTKVIVGGQGEGAARTFVTVGGGTGFDLREVFLDAKDINKDELNDAQYMEALRTRGRDYLMENASVENFEAEVIEKIRNARLNGFTHYMVVVAEGAGSAFQVAERIKEETALEPRVTVLGHIQRGGNPTARDRVTATRMGYRAVDILAGGGTNRIVCLRNGTMCDMDIDEALAMQKGIDKEEFTVLESMTGV